MRDSAFEFRRLLAMSSLLALLLAGSSSGVRWHSGDAACPKVAPRVTEAGSSCHRQAAASVVLEQCDATPSCCAMAPQPAEPAGRFLNLAPAPSVKHVAAQLATLVPGSSGSPDSRGQARAAPEPKPPSGRQLLSLHTILLL